MVNAQGHACYVVKHAWGKSYIPRELVVIQYPAIPKSGFKKKYDELARKKEKPSAEELRDLAEWALNHGEVEGFHQTISKLIKSYPFDPIAVAFRKVQDQLKERPS